MPHTGAPTRFRSLRQQVSGTYRPVEHTVLLGLVAVVVVLTVCISLWPTSLPLNLMVIPLVLGSVFLGPRELPWFVVFLIVGFSIAVSRQTTYSPRILVAVGVIFTLGLIVMLTSFRRSRLGVGGLRGESMLVDLRDRIQRQGELPDLPEQWYAETALRSAGGTKFAGDFVVATRSECGKRLELCLVDVSGKGEQAGTRSLLLSGCFSGLLGALPPERFLREANRFLLAQEWDEGFATAVHLSLEIETGQFVVRTAGHPPAVHLHAGSGRWSVLASEGPALGLLPEADHVAASGVLAPGDVILLYTDGLVETSRRDIDSGIDRLLGQAERMHARPEGLAHAAETLIDTVGSRKDDRALVLLHRRS